jgi:hypothetical protein
VTDGANTDPKELLYDYINEERVQYALKGRQPPAIFTYSFGGSAPEDVPKNLACQYDGVWSRISDEENLADSMGAYYKYVSYGLGGDTTSKSTFVAWYLHILLQRVERLELQGLLLFTIVLSTLLSLQV